MRTIKRLSFVLIVLLGLLPVCAFQALAAGIPGKMGLRLEEAGNPLHPGDVVRVQFVAHQVTALAGIEITFRYDPSQLRLQDEGVPLYNDAVLDDTGLTTIDRNAGYIRLVVWADDLINGISADLLEVAELPFEILQTGSISLQFSEVKAVDIHSAAIHADTQGGLQFHAVPGVAIEEAEVWMDLNDRGTHQLSVSVAPADADLVWASSRPDVVTVDQNGKLTAVSPGESEVTVSAGVYGGTLDAVRIVVGTIIKLEWDDDATWAGGSLAERLIVALDGSHAVGTATVTNASGEAIFPEPFEGDMAFMVLDYGYRDDPAIQTGAYRAAMGPDRPTASGTITLFPLKSPNSEQGEAFGIRDIVWFAEQWARYARDFDQDGVINRNDLRILLRSIPSLVQGY